MKSIIEEASSISKAIENGWLKAGKPKEFSVKIFEEPKKNFFGITIKSAKIGIFFSDNKVHQEVKLREKPVIINKQQPKSSVQITEQEQLEQKNSNSNLEKLDKKETKKHISEKTSQSIWTQQMMGTITNWLEQILSDINDKQEDKINFSITQDNFHLKIYFQNPIFLDKTKEKQLFSSLSTLMLQMLKKQYRRPLKGYRIIFVGF